METAMEKELKPTAVPGASQQHHGPSNAECFTRQGNVENLHANQDTATAPISRPQSPTGAADIPRTVHHQRLTQTTSDSEDTQSEQEDDNFEITKPKGRLASRMNVRGYSRDDYSSKDEDQPIGAYARIRKQIMAEGLTNVAVRSPDETDVARRNFSANSDTSDAEDEDDDDNVSAKPRRRRLRQKQATSLIYPSDDASQSSPPSPGLFVSPHKSSTVPRTPGRAQPSNNTVASSPLESNSTLRSPVRHAGPRPAKAKNQEQRARAGHNLNDVSTDPIEAAESDSDGVASASLREKLTEQSRPTRKASKKAIAEMQRETQRMSRNMQLGYREKTKKRFSTKDLFERFNFKQDTPSDPMRLVSTSLVKDGKSIGETRGADTHTMLGSSDVDASLPDGAETPPTSPLYADENSHSVAKGGTGTRILTSAPQVKGVELPSAKVLMEHRGMNVNKGKGRDLVDQQVERDDAGNIVRSFRIKAPESQRPGQQIILDSDEEASPPPQSRLAVFDRVAPRKMQQPRSLLVQRSLAHARSPGRPGHSKYSHGQSVTPASLQNELRLKAHQQALEAKREHIASLRARGIYVESEEEKQEREEFVADSLQRARQEAQLIADREREERKQGSASKGDHDMLSSDEDEDYITHNESEDDEREELSGASDLDDSEGVELEDLDLSGSSEEEEEEEEKAEEEDDEEATKMGDEDVEVDDRSGEPTNPDHHATIDGTVSNQAPSQHGTAMNNLISNHPTPSHNDDSHRNFAFHNRHRRRHILDDDDDESAQDSHDHAQDDALAAFGFSESGKSPITMTQMFVGTMANLDSQSQGTRGFQRSHVPEEDSLAFLRDLPPTDLPEFDDTVLQSQVPNDHERVTSQRFQAGLSPAVGLGGSQSQRASLFETPSRLSEVPDPTQDEGFIMSQGITAGPHSTTETVVLGVPESPLVTKKRGRLVRRHDTSGDNDKSDSEVERTRTSAMEQETIQSLHANTAGINDAFQKLRNAAKVKSDRAAFDKQKSGAKEMMDEQAEESEDEYAGIGGASDDEIGEEDEEDRAMIDNEMVKVDERKIAALHAEQTRIEDERRLNQLHNDITTGAFRRRRGGELELSDDEDDIAAERRRRKQREFARRTKALLADEKIGELAEHTKKQAFLNAIADRDDEEDAFDFLDDTEEDARAGPALSQRILEQPPSTGDMESTTAVVESAGVVSSTAPQKRKMFDASDRRTNLSKRPRTELELKKTISDLIEEPLLIPDSQFSDDEGLDAPDVQSTSGRTKSTVREVAARSDAPTAEPRPVTDRLALAEMSDATVNATLGTAMAFQTGDSTISLFKVPALLRRTTTNLSAASTKSSTSASGATTPVNMESGGGMKRGGSKKSNIHYQAREAERRRAVEESERRRKDGVRKKVTGRAAGGSVLGRMFKGSRGGFE